MIAKTPFQSFKLNLDDIQHCIRLVYDGIDTRRTIASELGMGEKKVEGLFEWAEFLGLLDDRLRTKPQSLTDLGRAMLQIPWFPGNVQAMEVLYAKLFMNHPLINRIVNSFMFNVSRQFEPDFDRDVFRAALLQIGQDFNVSLSFLAKRAHIYLDVFTNPAGFGQLGMVVQKDSGKFQVNPHRPDWKPAAYILYEIWSEGASAMKIGNMVNGQNSLGRMFFLSEPQVMVLLSKLEQEHIISLEMVADLYQIGRNPVLESRHFLEMLVHGRD